MNKRIKLATAVVALLMVAAIVVTFEACKKEEAITETTQKTPIAVKNVKTGEMTYNLTAQKIQKYLKETSFEKNDSYIVESFEITSFDTNDPQKEFVVLSVIDTDSEVSNKTFFNDAFLKTETKNDNVLYYFADNVKSGSFSFVGNGNDGYYMITVENFQVSKIEKIGDELPDFASSLPYTVTCSSKNCAFGGCRPVMNAQGEIYDCSPCGKDPGPDVWCNKEFKPKSNGGGASVVDIIGFIIGIISIFK